MPAALPCSAVPPGILPAHTTALVTLCYALGKGAGPASCCQSLAKAGTWSSPAPSTLRPGPFAPWVHVGAGTAGVSGHCCPKLRLGKRHVWGTSEQKLTLFLCCQPGGASNSAKPYGNPGAGAAGCALSRAGKSTPCLPRGLAPHPKSKLAPVPPVRKGGLVRLAPAARGCAPASLQQGSRRSPRPAPVGSAWERGCSRTDRNAEPAAAANQEAAF